MLLGMLGDAGITDGGGRASILDYIWKTHIV